MRVNELAQAAEVSTDTVRHYLRIGLIKAEQRLENGYQQFSNRTVKRIQFIRSAVGLGFKLTDVADLLRMSERGSLPCPRARVILAERLQETQHQIEQKMVLFKRMKRALTAWESTPDGVPEGHQVCGLIEGVGPGSRSTAGASHGGRKRLRS